MKYPIAYLEAELDSLKDNFAKSKVAELRWQYNEEIAETEEAIKILERNNKLVEAGVSQPSEPSCKNCEHKNICSQNVLFALGGWDAKTVELKHCSQHKLEKQ